MTKEEAKVQRAIRAARIAKQTLLEETRDRMPLEVDEDLVKVTRPKAENVTIKIPNQDKEGYGLAGVEEEYKIKKSFTEEEKRKLGADLAALLEKDPEEALREMETKIIARMRESVGRNKFKKSITEKEIIGYDVIYFKDGKREVESFRNLKKIPTKRGRSIPDIQPVKVFAIKNDANTIKTIYK